jgi:hypothetical protein
VLLLKIERGMGEWGGGLRILPVHLKIKVMTFRILSFLMRKPGLHLTSLALPCEKHRYM